LDFCLLFLTPIRLGEEVEHWSSIGGESRVTKNLSISYLYCEVERKEKKGRKEEKKGLSRRRIQPPKRNLYLFALYLLPLTYH
jgi:hypothetical protein